MWCRRPRRLSVACDADGGFGPLTVRSSPIRLTIRQTDCTIPSSFAFSFHSTREEQTMTTPFFMTHHAPVGAWASLTFGLPGRGLCIDHETLKPEPNADLLVAIHRDGVTTA